MDDYKKVNDEIKDFLTNKKETTDVITNTTNINSQKDVENVLENIQTLYSEISTYLKFDNEKALKDVLLRNDIKMNLVNESLLNTLSTAIKDKNKLLEENNQLTKDKNELEQKYTKSKYYAQKLESDVEFKISNVSELNRIIQDQKQKLSEISLKIEKYKNEIKDKDRLRIEAQTKLERQIERYSAYDKEMEMLNNLAGEREEALKRMLNEKREEENKNSSIKIKIVEIERELEQTNQKLSIKDKNLTMCNEELSKLLIENKQIKIDINKYKSNANYYEKINKNLNNQNSYLNKQLNRIIESEKYLKEGIDVVELYENKKRKYKKKIKQITKEIKKLSDENEELKNKIEDNAYKITAEDDTVILKNKIETLAKINKEYKDKIETMQINIDNNNNYSDNNNKHTNKQTTHNDITNKYTYKDYKYKDNIYKDKLNDRINKIKEELNKPYKINKQPDDIYNMSKIKSAISDYNYKSVFDRYKHDDINKHNNKEEVSYYNPVELHNKYNLTNKSTNKYIMGGYADESDILTDKQNINNISDIFIDKETTNKIADKLSMLDDSYKKIYIDDLSSDSTTFKNMNRRVEKLNEKLNIMEKQINE